MIGQRNPQLRLQSANDMTDKRDIQSIIEIRSIDTWVIGHCHAA